MDREKGLLLLNGMLELPPGHLKGPEQLQDLAEWDSLAVVSFMALADEHYGVTVRPQQILACKTIADLLDVVEPQNTELSRQEA